MKIFIDADGCPVVDLTVKTAKQHSLECYIICDTAHEFNKDGAQTIIVEKGADSADFRLVNLVAAGDIVVTQDYGLAAMCLAKKAVPLSQNGLVFTDKNIDELLFSRYVSKKIRNAGGRLKGPSKRTPGQDESFVQALENLIQ